MSAASKPPARRTLLQQLWAPLLVLLLVPLFVATRTQAATEVYPELQTLPATDLHFDTVTLADGQRHKVLRFSNTVANYGQGRLEMEGSYNPSSGKTRVYQNIYNSDGALARSKYVGEMVYHESHQHWHFENFAFYQLYTASNGTLGQAMTGKKGEKTTFCVMDTVKVTNLPGSPSSPVYSQCGQTKQGLSVGWGDTYGYTLADQWIDLGVADGTPHLPDGQYAIQSTADPLNLLLESNDTNNAKVTYFYVQGGQPALGTGGSGGGTCLAESAHPYTNNFDYTWTLTNPDTTATQTRIHFGRLETERGYDYVYVRDGNGTQVNRFDGTYSSGAWSNAVTGRTVKVQLTSDSSVTAWGFCVDRIETVSSSGSNTAPTADPKSVTTNEDTPVSITLTGADAQQCELTFAIVTPPTKGRLGAISTAACVSGSPNRDSASTTYTPNPNITGSDSFTYKVNDGAADSTAVTVSITITAQNDAPVAANKSVTTSTSTPVSITLTGTDVETCELTFSTATAPINGSLGTIGTSACAAGTPNTDSATVSYTPNPSFTGTDSFTYQVSDGVLSSTAAVSISVTSSTATLHVADLDGRSQILGNGNKWKAHVSITVHDGAHQPVANATVTIDWSIGGTASCQTESTGTCRVQSGTIARRDLSVTATVQGVTHATLSYNATDNHDPESDSDGTRITVNR